MILPSFLRIVKRFPQISERQKLPLRASITWARLLLPGDTSSSTSFLLLDCALNDAAAFFKWYLYIIRLIRSSRVAAAKSSFYYYAYRTCHSISFLFLFVHFRRLQENAAFAAVGPDRWLGMFPLPLFLQKKEKKLSEKWRLSLNLKSSEYCSD